MSDSKAQPQPEHNKTLDGGFAHAEEHTAVTNQVANRIINGDCLEELVKLPANSIDLVLTDPPYKIVSGGMTNQLGGIFDRAKHPNTATGKMFDHNEIEFTEWLPEVYRVLKSGCHAYVMSSGRQLNSLTNAAILAGFEFQNLLVWDKGSVTPNRYYMQRTEFILMLKKGKSRTINDAGSHNIIYVPNIVGTKRHPTEKPVGLMEYLIRNSTHKGDVVLDPFAGSGATLVAANHLSRQYIGIELNADYAKIAQARLSQTEGSDLVALDLELL